MTEADPAASIYAVFAYPLTRPGNRELLVAYTSLARAYAFVAAQDADVQANLRVEELKLNVQPMDEFWKQPEGVASADPDGERGLGTRLVELLQEGDLLPDDAIAAIEATRNAERDVVALRQRIAEFERGRSATLGAILETVTTQPAAEAVRSIERMLGHGVSRSLADLREEMRTVARGERKMPPLRRAMLETPVARERFLSQLALIRSGVLDPQGADPVAADQERLVERNRVLQDLEDELRRAWGWPPCKSE